MNDPRTRIDALLFDADTAYCKMLLSRGENFESYKKDYLRFRGEAERLFHEQKVKEGRPLHPCPHGCHVLRHSQGPTHARASIDCGWDGTKEIDRHGTWDDCPYRKAFRSEDWER